MRNHIKINRTRWLFIMLFFLSHTFLWAQEEKPLDPYLQIAADQNPQLKSLFHQYLAALEEVPQVGTLPDPQVMLGYYILPVETRVGSRVFDVELSQTFPWFGTLAAKKDEASRQAVAVYQEFLVEKNKLLYEVKAGYYQLYTLQKNISITEDYLKILKKDERLALTKVEAGRASMVDVLRVQMEIKENQTQLEFVRDQMKTVMTSFNTLLGRSADNPVQIADSISLSEINADKQALLDSVMNRNPKLNKLRDEATAMGSRIAVAKKSGMPSFSVGISHANITRRTDTDMPIPQNGQDMLMPKVTVSIPLYRSKYKAVVNEATLRQQSIQHQISNTQNQLNADLVAAVNQYRDAQRKSNLYQELMVQAQQTLNIITEAYIGGEKDYEEVLRVEQQLLKYQLALENAKGSLNTSVALVEKLWSKDIK